MRIFGHLGADAVDWMRNHAAGAVLRVFRDLGAWGVNRIIRSRAGRRVQRIRGYFAAGSVQRVALAGLLLRARG